MLHLAALLFIAQMPSVEGIVWSSPKGQDQLGDLYLPKGDGPFPVAIYIHGGGWTGGDRKQFRRQAAHMAGLGFAGFLIDYRLAPANVYPAAWEDTQASVQWVRENASKYHFDTARIAAVGGSAGGNLAALLGTSGKGATHVDAVVAFNPVLDLSDTGGQVKSAIPKYVGGTCDQKPVACKEGSPLQLVHENIPPFLILHGTADPTVPFAEATSMVAALKAAGNRVELFTAEGGVHSFFSNPPWYAPTEKAMETFLVKVFAR